MKLSTIVCAGVLAGAVPAAAQSITDAQIAAIVVTANQVDVDAGELARRSATNPEVKKFAEQMIADHTGVNKSAVDLATRLKVTPEENATSKALRAGGEKNVAKLKTLTGAAFDKAYVDHEVAYHAQVLEALDKTLIPGATNRELKALLVKVRPAFVAHLEHAKHLQQVLAAAHTVTMDATSFTPADLSIKAGDTVIWVNRDMFPHTATDTGTNGFDSGTLAAGASWTRTFTSKADISYACLFHPTMKGRLQVK